MTKCLKGKTDGINGFTWFLEKNVSNQKSYTRSKTTKSLSSSLTPANKPPIPAPRAINNQDKPKSIGKYLSIWTKKILWKLLKLSVYFLTASASKVSVFSFLDNIKHTASDGDHRRPLPLNPPPIRPPRKNSPSMRAKNDRSYQQGQTNKSKIENQSSSNKEIEEASSTILNKDTSKETVGHFIFSLCMNLIIEFCNWLHQYFQSWLETIQYFIHCR